MSSMLQPLPQIEFLHLIAQGIARHTQQAGGLRLVAIGLLQRAHQQASLVIFERKTIGRNLRPHGRRNVDAYVRS